MESGCHCSILPCALSLFLRLLLQLDKRVSTNLCINNQKSAQAVNVTPDGLELKSIPLNCLGWSSMFPNNPLELYLRPLLRSAEHSSYQD